MIIIYFTTLLVLAFVFVGEAMFAYLQGEKIEPEYVLFCVVLAFVPVVNTILVLFSLGSFYQRMSIR